MTQQLDAERFWSKVEKTDGCWEWRAYRHLGYGYFGIGSRKDKSARNVFAHRFAYEALVGPIPEGLQIDHLCRNRGCVNPAHLEPVTRRENLLRGESPVAHCARKTHCPKGHPYDATNTIKTKRGNRLCRACKAVQNRARYVRPLDPEATR